MVVGVEGLGHGVPVVDQQQHQGWRGRCPRPTDSLVPLGQGREAVLSHDQLAPGHLAGEPAHQALDPGVVVPGHDCSRVRQNRQPPQPARPAVHGIQVQLGRAEPACCLLRHQAEQTGSSAAVRADHRPVPWLEEVPAQRLLTLLSRPVDQPDEDLTVR